MKKIISVILLLALLVSLAACAGENVSVADTKPAETTEVETTAPETDEPKKPDPMSGEVEKRIILKKDAEERMFVDSTGYELPYRLYVPKDYSEEYAYPLTLFLHGSGESGSDNGAQLTFLINNLFIPKDSPAYHSIVVIPQCPSEERWVDNDPDLGYYSVDEIPIAKSMSAVVELLDSIMEEFSINEDRQYVLGLSMGGYGTWDIISRFPDRFAAAIPLCGGGDPTKGADLVNIPIHAFHSTGDDDVPVSGTANMVKAIKDAGGEKIIYTEYENLGHEIWDTAINENDLSAIEWMFEQRRS